jgi:hypothetical protein
MYMDSSWTTISTIKHLQLTHIICSFRNIPEFRDSNNQTIAAAYTTTCDTWCGLTPKLIPKPTSGHGLIPKPISGNDIIFPKPNSGNDLIPKPNSGKSNKISGKSNKISGKSNNISGNDFPGTFQILSRKIPENRDSINQTHAFAT